MGQSRRKYAGFFNILRWRRNDFFDARASCWRQCCRRPGGDGANVGTGRAVIAVYRPQTGGPLEFDLFAEPNGPYAKAPRQSGYLWSDAQGPVLSGLTHLTFDGDVMLSEGLATSRKQCQANFGNLVFAVILNDHAVHPAQVFFCQLFLSRLCGADPSLKLRSCAQPKSMFQYFVKNPFGTDDDLPLAGQPWLLQGQPTRVQLDLLPRLIGAIRSGRGGMDQNLSDWTVGSVYLGQIMYGDVTLQSTWRDVRLVAWTR